MSRGLRIQQLSEDGAVEGEIDELLDYNENHFDFSTLGEDLTLPLPDEPFVACWQGWVEEARRAAADGVSTFEILCHHLPQLRFPIRQDISQDPDYRRATLQGVDPDLLDAATGLELAHPEILELEIYPSIAGRVPVFRLYGRAQFETMVRALSKRNEPAPLPPAMGAQMIAGFNNWTRIQEHHLNWQNTPEDGREHATWKEAFAAIRQHKALYQDRLALLSDGPYSAIPAADLGLSDAVWRAKSLLIRREHECTHYFTRRVFGSMRNHLLDELMADYAGIVAVEGNFRADWFLRFMGLEDPAQLRPGGRLEIYRGDPPLSDGAFRVLQRQMIRAAEHLERFDRNLFQSGRTAESTGRVLIALATLSIDRLASPDGLERLRQAVDDIEQRL